MLQLACMEIKYNAGQLEIKGKKEVVLVDPLEYKKNNGRIILFGNKEKDINEYVDGKVLISGPGEYEVGGIEIKGIGIDDGGVMYLVETEGVMIVVIADLKEPISDKKLEKIEAADVLLVDITNIDKIGYKNISAWVKKWGVNYLIPLYDGTNGRLEKFLDEADEEGLEAVESIKVARDELPDGVEVMLLKRE